MGGEQCLVIYILSRAGARRLDPDQYFNFLPSLLDNLESARVVHFFGTDSLFKRA